MKFAAGSEEQEESFLKWLRQKQEQFSWLKNASFELLNEYPNRTINVCPDGPKILVLPNASDIIYCYTREQWIDKLWLDLRLRPFHYPIIILNFLIFLFGATGNVFVCLSVYRNHQLRNVTNYFIVNLAFADLLVIIICLPATVVWDLSLTWFFGTLPCKLIMFLQDVSISVSVLTLTAISIDRYYAICHPLKFKSNLSQAKRVIALIWIVSLLIMAPDVIYLRAKQADDLAEAGLDTVLYSDCNYDLTESSSKLFQFVKTILLYMVPFILMFCAHFRIMRTLQRASNMEQAQQKQPSEASVSGLAEADYLRSALDLARQEHQQQQQPAGHPDTSGGGSAQDIELALASRAPAGGLLGRAASERKSAANNKRRPRRLQRYGRQLVDFRLAAPLDKGAGDNRRAAAAGAASKRIIVTRAAEPDADQLSGRVCSRLAGSGSVEKQTTLGGGSVPGNDGENEPRRSAANSFEKKNMPDRDNLFLIKTSRSHTASVPPGRRRKLMRMNSTLGGSMCAPETASRVPAAPASGRMGSVEREEEARGGPAASGIPKSGSRWKHRLKQRDEFSSTSLNQSSLGSVGEQTMAGFGGSPATGSGQPADLKVTMHNKTKLESRRKAAKMLMAIVVMFGICYLPVHLINFLRDFIDDIPQTDVTSTISMLAHCVCYLNSAINPIIYNHMNSIFRAEFSKFLSCFYCRRRRLAALQRRQIQRQQQQQLAKLPASTTNATMHTQATSPNGSSRQQTEELRAQQLADRHPASGCLSALPELRCQLQLLEAV